MALAFVENKHLLLQIFGENTYFSVILLLSLAEVGAEISGEIYADFTYDYALTVNHIKLFLYLIIQFIKTFLRAFVGGEIGKKIQDFDLTFARYYVHVL